MPEAQAIGVQQSESGVDLEAQADLMLERTLTHQREAVLQGFADDELRPVQDHLTGLDLRQVENVVDEFEQMFAGAPDVAQVVVLTLVELSNHAFQEHFGKADDGVQRRTELVGRYAGHLDSSEPQVTSPTVIRPLPTSTRASGNWGGRRLPPSRR